MKRRKLLQSGTVATAALLSGCESSEEAPNTKAPTVKKDTTELTMVTSWPKNFPGLGTAAERFSQRVETASDGRYKIKVFGGGELVHPLKCHDAVQEGTADLYHSADYYYVGKAKALGFFTAVPFGFRADEMDAWLHHGGGQALWDEVNAQFGIKSLPAGNSGSQMGGWFRSPIHTLEDFKGLKMRIPGLGGDVINALGGTAVTLGGSEIMPALEAGTIDATEWVGPWNDLAFGFYKIVKNYYYPGFHEPGPSLALGIGKKHWDRFSRADKALFENCALAENNYDLAEFNANNSAALEVLVDKHDVQLTEFSDAVFTAIGEASRDVVASAGAADPLATKVYDSYMSFRKKALDWSRYSDQAYMTKRDLLRFA